MTAYDKGPYQVEFSVQVTIGTQVINRKHTVNCRPVGSPAPGTPMVDINFQTLAASTTNAATAINAYWALARVFYSSTGAALVSTILWKVNPDGNSRTFISAHATTNPTGATGGTPIAGHQVTLTFRSGKGGIMKLTFIETNNSGKSIILLSPNAAGNAYQKLAAYVLSGSGWIAARGLSWPVSANKVAETYNEVAERARFRAS